MRQELEHLLQSPVLKHPLGIFEVQLQRLDELKKRMGLAFESFAALKQERFLALLGKLESLGPLATLKRGFSVTLRFPGEKTVLSAQDLRPGDRVKTLLSKGFFISEVKDVKNG